MRTRQWISLTAGMLAFAGGAALAQDATATAAPAPSGRGAFLAQLTPDQRTQLKSLRDQLEAGDITADQFRTQVQSILGDIPLPPGAGRHMGPGGMRGEFARHGGPGRFGPDGMAPHARLAAELNLTDDQKTQAKAIFQQAHTDVKVLRSAALQSIRGLLTSDQQAIVDQFLANHPAPGNPAGAGVSGNDGVGTAATGGAAGVGSAAPSTTKTLGKANAQAQLAPAAAADAAAQQQPVAAGAPLIGFGPHGHGPGAGFGPQRFGMVRPLLPPPVIQQLNLTDDQKASIKPIRETLTQSVKTRMDQAKTDFRALLTTDQQAQLDALKAAHGRPNQAGFQGAAPASAN